MIPTKTYPLSAIMGKEIEKEYERGYAQGCEEGKERIAELEAQLADANEMLEKCNSKFIVALEAEVKTLREGVEKMLTRLEVRGFTNDDPLFMDLNIIYWAARMEK